MNLKSNSFIAKFHKLVYSYLPDDFCTLFWNTLFAVILFPFIWIVVLFGGRNGSVFYRSLLGLLIQALVYWLVYNLVVNPHVRLIFGSALAVVLVAIALGYAAFKAYDSISTSDTASNTRQMIDNIKGKYCTKITWKK